MHRTKCPWGASISTAFVEAKRTPTSPERESSRRSAHQLHVQRSASPILVEDPFQASGDSALHGLIFDMAKTYESSPYAEANTDSAKEPFLGPKGAAWESRDEEVESDLNGRTADKPGMLHDGRLWERRRTALSANAAWLCHAALLSASLLFFALSFCVRPAHISDRDYTEKFSAWCKYFGYCFALAGCRLSRCPMQTSSSQWRPTHSTSPRCGQVRDCQVRSSTRT